MTHISFEEKKKHMNSHNSYTLSSLRQQYRNEREGLTCVEQVWVSPCLNISDVMKGFVFLSLR